MYNYESTVIRIFEHRRFVATFTFSVSPNDSGIHIHTYIYIFKRNCITPYVRIYARFDSCNVSSVSRTYVRFAFIYITVTSPTVRYQVKTRGKKKKREDTSPRGKVRACRNARGEKPHGTYSWRLRDEFRIESRRGVNANIDARSFSAVSGAFRVGKNNTKKKKIGEEERGARRRRRRRGSGGTQSA